MSIQDWGAIGEIVAAAGVIATLVFLSLQIRANTREARLSATAQIARDYNTYLQHISASDSLSELWTRLVDGDPAGLEDHERARGIMVLGNFMRIMESAWLQHQAGRMDQPSWQGYERLLSRSTGIAFFPIYWQMRAPWHSDAFRAHVDALAADPSVDAFPMFSIADRSGSDE